MFVISERLYAHPVDNYEKSVRAITFSIITSDCSQTIIEMGFNTIHENKRN